MERRKFIKNIMAVSATVAVPSMVFADLNASKKTVSTIEGNTTRKVSNIPTVKGTNDLPYEEALKAIIGEAELKDAKKVKLTVPEIAENGAVVPVKVSVESPMTQEDYVKSIHILNTKNANSRCVDVMLTVKNAEAKFASRVKLAESQDIVAVVGLSDGTFMKVAKSVKVTIGGCG
ncbi:MAG: Sulfur oxidation protein SoxY [uncultured Sulfurovum sp.]|uniref:Sulfur oxidation protein SoxY n=1 Tax=uncultured Sulfurovum sp. TaxID=269237 RepID=A0A6S6TCG4_9BACT|nr:MAG: Sulfur oxidation protein SoxY [uncultured Sulfurovum sp.]